MASRAGGGTPPAPPGPGGTFDHWLIHAEAMPEIEDWCGAWARKHLRGYTGMANFETIGGRIIEAHLRFADQWPDLYGPGWVEAVVRLHVTGDWVYPDADRADGYSVVLFGPHGPRYRHPPAALVDEVRAMPGVSSVQITFHEDKAPGAPRHAARRLPPGDRQCHDAGGWRVRARETARGASFRIKRPSPTAPRPAPADPRRSA